mgnify:CR=1 FL=1
MVKNNVRAKRFKKVGLHTSLLDKNSSAIGKHIEEILSYKGIKTLYDETFSKLNKSKIQTHTDQYILKNSDLVIAIGGDGAMLSCSRKYGAKDIPILGINLGKVGFLTDIAPDEVTSKLLEVIEGNYDKDKRFFLETNINNKKERFIALNEVVIHSGAIAQLIEFDLFIDETFVYRQKADGLIVNSPTGSTAYSLSGGGPIMHPSLDAITILPMFPHSLSSSPLIVSAESAINIRLSEKSSSAQISFDSHNFVKLKGKNEIHIGKSQSMLELIHPIDHDFYDGCRSKLGWSTGIAKS